MDIGNVTYDFMKNELIRLQNKENEILKSRNSLINLMFISSSSIIAVIGVLVKYAKNDFVFFMIGFILPILPLAILFQYLRILNNVGELSIARLQKFLNLLFFDLNDITPKYYLLYDLYPSTKKSYFPESQLSGFTPKTKLFLKVLLFSIFFIINNAVFVAELYLLTQLKILNKYKLLSNLKHCIEKWDWMLLLLFIFLNLYILFKMWKSLKSHISNVEELFATFLGYLRKYNLVNKTLES